MCAAGLIWPVSRAPRYGGPGLLQGIHRRRRQTSVGETAAGRDSYGNIGIAPWSGRAAGSCPERSRATVWPPSPVRLRCRGCAAARPSLPSASCGLDGSMSARRVRVSRVRTRTGPRRDGFAADGTGPRRVRAGETRAAAHGRWRRRRVHVHRTRDADGSMWRRRRIHVRRRRWRRRCSAEYTRQHAPHRQHTPHRPHDFPMNTPSCSLTAASLRTGRLGTMKEEGREG